VLRIIFVTKREEVEGGWRRRHEEGQVACMGEMRYAYNILIEKKT
jgi:hypothetical protein